VDDGAGSTGQDSAHIIIDEVNQNPTISIAPSDITTSSSVEVYNSDNGEVDDADLPDAVSTDPGYVNCVEVGADTCSFNVTVSGSGTGPTSCHLSFTCAGAETCSVDVQAQDGYGATSASDTVNITCQDSGGDVNWTDTSTSASLCSVESTTRIQNNYPADHNEITLNFDGAISACNAQVDCNVGGTTITQSTSTSTSGSDCVITATSAYWHSDTVCEISNVTSTPNCLNCGAKTVAFNTSLRTNECSGMGGTCGGFIDDGTCGTGTTLEVSTIKKEDFSALVGAGGNYHVYALVERGYANPATAARQEAFDDNDDGTITFAAADMQPKKITVGYKGNFGACDRDWGDGSRDCFQMTTVTDVDARKIVIPVEYTTTENANLPKFYIDGDFTHTAFQNMIFPDPPTPQNPWRAFPNPMRIGFAASVYKNMSLADLNMDVIFQPSDTLSLILVCFGWGGNYEIAIETALPRNITMPDLIRSGATTTCSGGYADGPGTSWEYYTNERNTSMVMMVIGGLANAGLFNLDKGLNVAEFPIILKAFGTYTATIPATYIDGAGTSLGNTPFEIDYRDPDFPGRSDYNNTDRKMASEGGNASGIGISMLAMVDDLINDPERTAGHSPPYLNPNRVEVSALGWNNQDVRNGLLFSMGARAPASQPTNPGMIIAYQIRMTNKVDYGNYTVFMQAQNQTSGGPPWVGYSNVQPFSASSDNSGVAGEMVTGIPPTATDPGGQVDFSNIPDAISVSTTRPMVEPWTTGGTGTPFDTPGSTFANTVIGDITDGGSLGVTEFLSRPDITDPSHNGYYLPEQTSWWSPSQGGPGGYEVPINRNGQMYRGTAQVGDEIGELGSVDQAYYFTMSNPTLNVDSGRYADFFVMYLQDGWGSIDQRVDQKQFDMGKWNECQADAANCPPNYRHFYAGASYHGYPPRFGTTYPENRFWKIYGDLKGSAGAATYTVTIPWVQPGLRTLNVQGYVPYPYQHGRSSMPGTMLEWHLVNMIIGTDPSEGGVGQFDYQNQDFNWYNVGSKFASSDDHLFIWQD
jgi:hypothetical protein